MKVSVERRLNIECTHCPSAILTSPYLPDPQTVVTKLGSRQVSRELSFTSEKGGLAREPSFIYDTTVETFGSEGASIDDYKLLEEEESSGAHGVSIIGRIAAEIDTELVDPFQAGADSLHLGGDFDLNEEDTYASSSEKCGSVQVSFDEYRPSDLNIPLCENIQDRLFLTSSMINQEDKAMNINVPDAEAKRLSNSSTDGACKISSTPEAESYFMKREESFIKKVFDGELQNLAVEVSDYFISLEPVDEALVVKPISEDPEAEIEITDLRPESSLIVKPVNEPRGHLSSFERVYDKISLEEIPSHSKMTKEEILASLGENFQGTVETPDFASSFDEIYQLSSVDTAQTSSRVCSMEFSADLPGRRWTAPEGTVEAPILAAEEFSVRFEPVVERTEGHWEELERMVEGERRVVQSKVRAVCRD